MRRFVLALAVAILFLPAIPAPARALPPGGLFGGDLRVALQAAPDLDPLQFAQNRAVQELVYDSLTRLGTDMRPSPWLASSWTTNVAARTITMNLRTATWADGSPITAQDVRWSFGKYPPSVVTGLTVTGSGSTVTFTFASGGGDFLGNAATLPIAWKDQSNTPVQNGPFLKGPQNATALRLTANAGHWNTRPFLDAITFGFPYTLAKNADDSTKANDAACALLKGKVELIGWGVSQTDTSTSRDCVAGYGGWSDGVNRTLFQEAVAEAPGLRFLYVGMNTQRAPLTDPTLRKALSMAIDRDLIAGTYGNPIEPKVDIADSPVNGANAAWFNASIPKYRVLRVPSGANAVPSLDEVNAFLDAAGYLDRNGDGWRDTPAGTPFNFTLLTYDEATDPKVAKYSDLLTKFRSIGINVVQQEKTPAALRAIIASDAFDLYTDIQDATGEPSFLFGMLHTGSPGNLVNLASPALDAFLESARDALDPAARSKAVLDAQDWIAEQVPLAPIIHYRALYSANRTTFEGWIAQFGGIVNFWSFTLLHVAQHGPLTMSIDPLQRTVRSGGGTDVLVRARDQDDNPVAGVSLNLTGAGLATTDGVTDSQGTFTVRFNAPSVATPRQFTLGVDAAKAGYLRATGFGNVTVNPASHGLIVTLAKNQSKIASGNSTTVSVVVLDGDTATVLEGANVSVAISPAGLGASVAHPTGITGPGGTFTTSFTADVTVQSRFVITVTVSKAGYEDLQAGTTIEVSPRSAPGTAPPTPALDTISMVAIVATLAALYGAWQRRKWIQRKP